MFGAAKPNPFPHLADVTADLAAREAFTAALEAAAATGHADTFINAAVDGLRETLAARPRQLSRGRKADRPLVKGTTRADSGQEPAVTSIRHSTMRFQSPFPLP